MSLLKLVTKLFSLIFQAIFAFLKLLLYRPFVKLYYLIFKIKKYNLGNQSKFELFRKKSFHFIALFFVILALFFNTSSHKTASAALGKQKVSVMEELVRDEFDDSGQNNSELVEKLAQHDKWEMLTNNRYLDDRDYLQDSLGLGSEEESTDSTGLAMFQNNTVIKPQQVIDGNDESPLLTEEQGLAERDGIVKYIVASGDSISTIARNFNINVNTVLWANNLTAFSIIRPGDELSILPKNGFLYKVKRGDNLGKLAQSYDTTIEKILDSNKMGEGDSIQIGQELIIPGIRRISTPPNKTVASKPSGSSSGLNVIKDIITADAPIVSSNKMLWPTTGYRITQYFSWSHNGLDIADKVGTSIFASDSGTVEISQGGWNGGYGNTIVINHGGGKKTRYGHMSKLLVSKGDKVEKGKAIGLMGSTGRSTGSHLHFEVIINGARYNPLNYIR